ncbi:MAG: VWA domain-containing protein, partial [Gemmatimonadales bacterium]|nr:VWA domain-containing protein [Gemmatimonadales bacterium]
VKTFTEERELTLLVMVDQSGSARTGGPSAKVDRAVEVAAVLALAAARQHDRVGALLFTDHPEHVVPPRKGRRHAMRVIRDMLAFQPTSRGTDLAGAIRYAARLLRHRSIVVVLSDFQAEGWEQPFRQLAARHDVVAITVDDPRELAPASAGWIEFQDAESDQRTLVDTGSLAVRRRWKTIALRRQARRAQLLKASGADHLSLTTEGDFALPLRRIFAERLRRRGRRRAS